MITVESLTGCKMHEVMHGHGKDMFFYTYGVEGHPRLTRHDRYSRKDRSVVSTWRVDGEDRPSLEAAAVALNTPPVFTPEELEIMAGRPAEWDIHDRTVDFSAMYMLRRKGAIEINDRMCRLSDLAAAAIRAHAITIEAGTAETAGLGAKHESVGPQGIAKTTGDA